MTDFMQQTFESIDLHLLSANIETRHFFSLSRE